MQSTRSRHEFLFYIFLKERTLELGGNNAIIGKVAFFVCFLVDMSSVVILNV